MFTREDHEELLKEQAKKNAKNGKPVLEMMAQAAVHADLLLGDPHWDKYLTYIQSAVENTEKHISALKTKLCDFRVVDHREILAIKLLLAQNEGRKEAWTSAIELPSQMRDRGEEAKLQIEEIKGGDDV